MTDPRIDLVLRHMADVPDFPKPGILFKDVTPLLANGEAFHACIELFAERLAEAPFDVIVGIESRGFIFGAALANRTGKGLVLVRKPGKLPRATHRAEYALEYGTDALEIHRDAFASGRRAVVLDDVLATGGTASAAAKLVQAAGGELVGFAFLLELGFLGGAARLAPHRVTSLVRLD